MARPTRGSSHDLASERHEVVLQDSVGPGLGHLIGGLLTGVLLDALLIGAALAISDRIRSRTRSEALLLVAFGLSVVVPFVGVWPFSVAWRDLDLQINRIPWEMVISEVRSGEIGPAAFDDSGTEVRLAGDQIMFFVPRPAPAMGPDPYCGFEYASTPDMLDADPGGSGEGVAQSMGGDWYWLCAS